MKIQLIATRSDTGFGGNDGAYPPLGLLTIAKELSRHIQDLDLSIEDQHHQEINFSSSEPGIVGIGVPSAICYRGVLEVSKKAKEAGKIVVLGGPYADKLSKKILEKNPFIDFVVRGKAEKSFTELVLAIQNNGELDKISGLSWRSHGTIIENIETNTVWQYDDYLPLPYEYLSAGINSYWKKYNTTNQKENAYSFVVFTHFGCGYKHRRMTNQSSVFTNSGKPRYCFFCSLSDYLYSRNPDNVLSEIKHYIDKYDINENSEIHLKCYGDNISGQKNFLRSFIEIASTLPWWSKYNFQWTIYCQSGGLDDELCGLLKTINVKILFIGFDAASDYIQRLNGLGTSMQTHRKTIALCAKYDLEIQASLMFGFEGETVDTLAEQYDFFQYLMNSVTVNRINTALLIINPGTPAYLRLAEKEPWILDLDYLSPKETLKLWLKHFTAITYDQARDMATRISQEAPGAKTSMGYEQIN